jgi:hypothetical protein
LYNKVQRVLFKSIILDSNCGFKAFKRDVFFELASEAGFDKKFERGWFWDAEILIRAQKKKLNIYEMSVPWREGPQTTFKLIREARMLFYILRFYQNFDQQ